MSVDAAMRDDASDDSSDGDSLGDKVDLVDDEQLAALRQKVAGNAYDYASHTALIDGLRARGDLSELRDARRHMASVYPLTPSMWLQWIEDEKGVSDGDDAGAVRALFESAAGDYVSVELWLEYAQWAVGTGDLSLTREVFERALSSCGLHVRNGSLLWDCYRIFETQVLSATPEEDKDALSAQRARVDSLYRRQLKLPLEGADVTHQEYMQFCNGSIDASVTNEYVKAAGRLPALELLEDALAELHTADSGNEAALLQAHRHYIRHEKTVAKDPARVQLAFERAVCDCPLEERLWIDYIDFAQYDIALSQVAYTVCTRAVRNVYWAAEVWRRTLLVAEQHGLALAQLHDLFERAWSATSAGDAADAVDLRLEYIFATQRHADETRVNGCTADSTADGDLCDAEWRRGLDALCQRYDDSAYSWDPTGDYRRAYARFAASRADFAVVDEMYKYFAETADGRTASMWIERCDIIGAHAPSACDGKADEARKHTRHVLATGINALAWHDDDDSADVLQLARYWLQMERECASDTASGILAAQKTVQQALLRVSESREQQRQKKASKKQGAKVEQKDKQRMHQQRRQKKVAERKKHDDGDEEQAKEKAGRKRAITSETGKAVTAAKQRRTDAVHSAADLQSFSASATAGAAHNAPSSSQSEFKMPFPVSAKRPESPRAANEQAAAASNSAEGDGPPQAQSADGDDEQERTVFVSNLLYTAADDVVKRAMSSAGDVLSVDLVKGRVRGVAAKGQHRGYGYVVFATKQQATAALSLDRSKVSGRPMFVQRALRKADRAAAHADGDHVAAAPRNQTVAGRVRAGLERNKLFVRNVPFDATETELTELFAHYGDVSAVRIVTQKSGKPKGIAYIDFSTDEAACKAVIAADNCNFKGRQLHVAISNPPAKRPSQPAGGQAHDAHGDSRPSSGQPQPRSRLSLSTVTSMQPRAVAAGAPPKKMSNAQFRHMLLNKDQ